ncbi:MAG: tetratricopeptide repeat protein [Bryobacteraceae bacterium]
MRFLAVFVLSAVALAAADPIETTFEQALQALSSHDYARAEQGFQAVLKTRPGNLGALGNLGVVYSRTHQYAKAIQTYRQALRSAPADQGLLLNLGLAYIKQEQYSDAKPLFARIVEARPANSQAQQLLATCQLYTSQVSEAVSRLETLRAAQPRDAGVLYLLGLGYYRLGEKEKAGALATELMSAGTAAQAQFLMGRAAYEGGLFDDAAGYLEKALQADPNIPGGQRELGKTYISLRRSSDALTALKLAIAADAADAEALYFLGGALVQEGNFDAAIAPLESARSRNPDFWGNYYYLGRVRLARNNPQEAAKLLAEAARLNPDEAAIYYQLARALKQAGRNDESLKALAQVKKLKASKLVEAAGTLECPVTSLDSPPKLMSPLKPLEDAVRAAGYNGTVRVQLTVTVKGDVAGVRVTPAHLQTASAVMEAIRHLRFCPAVVLNRPKEVPLEMNIKAQLPPSIPRK